MEAETKELKQDSLQLKQDNLQLKQDNLQLKQDNLQLEKQVSNLQYNLTTERQMVQSLSQHVSNVDDHLADVDNNIRILQDGLPNVEYRFNNQLRGLNETLAQKIQGKLALTILWTSGFQRSPCVTVTAWTHGVSYENRISKQPVGDAVFEHTCITP